MSDGIRPAPYQLVALSKILRNGYRAVLVADGVGVGKTISSGYMLLYITALTKKAGLVICPPSLMPKWMEELRSKFGMIALPIRSNEDLATASREMSVSQRKRVPVYVMPASIITRTRARDYPFFSVIVVDEIHNYRNKETKSFERMRELAELGDYRVGLSATPINNSLDDLVSELNLLAPHVPWDALEAALEDAWRSDKGTMIAPLFTRFTKDKLRIHFATRRIETRSVAYEPSYVSRVRKAIVDLHLRRSSRPGLYEDVTYYRLAASSPHAFSKSLGLPLRDKVADHKMETLKEILASETVPQWLVFCGFEETVRYLTDQLGDWECFVMTGDTPMFDRPGIIEAFQRSTRSLLVMTEVGSEGLDLQFCRGVINYDLHWNPMRLEQRIGRVDRVGQAKSEIVVYNLLVAGSIDERVIRVIRRKLDLVEGSVFSPGTLFGEFHSTAISQRPMFDSMVLSHEIEESVALLEALDQTNKLSTDDYSILPDIRAEYCLPANLAIAALAESPRNIWLRQSPTTLAWGDRLAHAAAEFQKLLDYYS